jgi:uncharacterized membrane protein
MIIPIILIGSALVFRALGFLGVPFFATWRDSVLCALTVMFCFTGIAHFGKTRADIEKMVPPWLASPRRIVMWTGILEILGAVGILIPETRFVAGICLIAFLVAVFPANIHAARTGATLAGKPATALWIRTPLQAFLIILVAWTCFG